MFKDSNCLGKISFGWFIKAPHIDIAVVVDLESENLYISKSRNLETSSIKMICENLSQSVKKIKTYKCKEQQA